MAMTVAQLEQEAILLSEDERVELISRLSNGIGTGMFPEIEQAWEEEPKRRIVDSGNVTTRNADELLAEHRADAPDSTACGRRSRVA